MKCNIPAVEAYTLEQAIHLKKKLQRHLETLTPTLHLELRMDEPSVDRKTIFNPMKPSRSMGLFNIGETSRTTEYK